LSRWSPGGAAPRVPAGHTSVVLACLRSRREHHDPAPLRESALDSPVFNAEIAENAEIGTGHTRRLPGPGSPLSRPRWWSSAVGCCRSTEHALAWQVSRADRRELLAEVGSRGRQPLKDENPGRHESSGARGRVSRGARRGLNEEGRKTGERSISCLPVFLVQTKLTTASPPSARGVTHGPGRRRHPCSRLCGDPRGVVGVLGVLGGEIRRAQHALASRSYSSRSASASRIAPRSASTTWRRDGGWVSIPSRVPAR
jgi:hypothetical protein